MQLVRVIATYRMITMAAMLLVHFAEWLATDQTFDGNIFHTMINSEYTDQFEHVR